MIQTQQHTLGMHMTNLFLAYAFNRRVLFLLSTHVANTEGHTHDDEN